MSQFLSQTFLIERLSGVFCYVVLVGVTYNSLYKADNYYRINRTLNICLTLLCIMAFFYIPAYTHDLSRIWQIIESWQGVSFNKWKEVFLTNTNSPGAFFLYFFAGKIGFRKILPTLACLVFFYNMFYIIKGEYKSGRSSNKALAITFLYIMSQGLFLGVISGVRSDIAFGLVLRAVYDDICLKKKTVFNYVLCGIAISFHISTILVIGVYLIFSLIDAWKYGSAFRKLTSTILLGLVAVLGYRSQSELLNNALGTARAYLFGNIYSYKWEYIIVIVSFTMLCMVLIHYRHVKKTDALRELYLMSIVLVIIVLPMIRSYTMFHRFANYTMLVSMPLIAQSIDKMIERRKIITVKIFKLICILVLLLACARGDLCGYKFFVL